MEEYVTLHCLVPKCPYTKKVPRDKSDPPNTAHVSLNCPWHETSDDTEVRYFDKDWKRIDDYAHLLESLAQKGEGQ